MMENVNDFYKTFKKVKNEVNQCCSTVSHGIQKLKTDIDKGLTELEENSKIQNHNRLLKIVRNIELENQIVTAEDIKLLLNKKITSDESTKRASKRKEIIQEEIDRLPENPSFEELKNIFNILEKLKKVKINE